MRVAALTAAQLPGLTLSQHQHQHLHHLICSPCHFTSPPALPVLLHHISSYRTTSHYITTHIPHISHHIPSYHIISYHIPSHHMYPIHHVCSPYDPMGRTFSGPAVTDNGFWDTFRTGNNMVSTHHISFASLPHFNNMIAAFVRLCVCALSASIPPIRPSVIQ